MNNSLRRECVGNKKIRVFLSLTLFSSLPDRFISAQNKWFESIERGDLGSIKCLIKSNSNIDQHATSGKTALHLAIEARENKLVELLIEKGASPESRDAWGRTPLHIAADSGNLEALKLSSITAATIELVVHTKRKSALEIAEQRELDYDLESKEIVKALKTWPKKVKEAKEETRKLQQGALKAIASGTAKGWLGKLPPDLARELVKEIIIFQLLKKRLHF